MRMLKKILIATFFFFSTLSPLFAGNFYLVPMLMYDKFSQGNNVNFYGISPRIAVGYGDWVLEEFYLALEAFVSPLESLTISSNGTTIIRPKYTFGAQALTGIILDYELKAFGIFGVVQSGFKNGGSKTGWQVGVGVDYVLSESWTLRIEYLHTRYHDNITADQGGLGLVYRFC